MSAAGWLFLAGLGFIVAEFVVLIALTYFEHPAAPHSPPEETA